MPETGFHQASDPLRGGVGNWDEAATHGAAVGHRVVLEANGEAVGLAPARRCGRGAAPIPGGAGEANAISNRGTAAMTFDQP